MAGACVQRIVDGWRRAKRGTVIVIAASLAASLGANAPAVATPATTARTSGWGEPVVENFDGNTLDPERWTAYHYPDTHPRRSRDLVSVRNGNLVLEGSVNERNEEIGSGVADHIDQNYGRWEVRFRVDAGAGYGAAILLWPSAGYRFPDDGEIDIMEVPKPTRQGGFNVVHLGPMNTQDGNLLAADFTVWHTVSVDWSPGQLVYYLDGVETWRAPTELVPDKVMRLALQLDECAPEVYGEWIPCRDASSPPTVAMDVDWVKVYPYDPSPSPPTSGGPSTQPTAPRTPASVVRPAPPARPSLVQPEYTG